MILDTNDLIEFSKWINAQRLVDWQRLLNGCLIFARNFKGSFCQNRCYVLGGLSALNLI